ncbi:MAG: hypothetical protein Q8M15_09025 [Bacteroidota bacterium]|nr:hypothetical protein [Bacteroidota bacterium]
MKKITFLLFLIFAFANISKAQRVILIKNPGSSTPLFANSFYDAVNIASPGASIYLPGGILLFNNSTINIQKPLNIYGVGYRMDSTLDNGGPTIYDYPIYLDTSAAGTLITGLRGGSIIIKSSNTSIIRCKVDIQFGYACSNVLLAENIIGSCNSYGYNLTAVVFRNNIFSNTLNSFTNTNFYNNVFLLSSYYILYSMNLNTLANNIFCSQGVSSSGITSSCYGNLLRNNLFIRSDSVSILHFNNGISASSSGNIFNQPLSTIFTNYSGTGVWNESQNFHLKPGCMGINKGSDTTDIGIYGGDFPFKEGAQPFNPRISKVSIPNNTNSSGLLPVKITIQAQDR